ncbi:pre-mRNA cleavage and polyadenylation factor (CPF) complex subunit [Orbilia oligospora]|uniref:Polyadenylation factor subunit 2 n=1 Tax=Orbilia oligospora TaxID=2813651 RepID=A0A7C8K3P5_ORBOL|nr:pre-mRNA cleavage and polyadenylation factor (CPF) complex subunit [Orbilia oligospora]KAF3195629.1 pre-mRNA cleavage and polyadenylation factor (CPF) complex subunit [Orbilia oligospora]KAF3255055.1 pre-mRNA cleavage and polyadenylation factor (CPF) complex subunit [Orbilia oligospora]KAF3255995.1 pre-mRNA cleavage and polyadenylation factor (CPF) complex subunit [Orbilia oligospora]KAF3294170.1 pre-mRNA cleavage and polyadenylation factor (CPF) complex subunit [Orbilia oligospora]
MAQKRGFEPSGNAGDGGPPRKFTHRRPVTDYGSSLARWIFDRRLDFRPHCQAGSSFAEEGTYLKELLPSISATTNVVAQIPIRHIHASLNKIKHPINMVKWTPEGRRLLTGSSSGEFTLWNGMGFNFETIMQAHDSAIRALEYSHGADWLLSGDQDGIVKYWQTNFNNVKVLQAHDSPVRDVSFCPTDAKFVTASDDGSLKIWNFGEGEEERILSGHGWDVKSAHWHPYKGLIASGSKDHLVKLWDPRSARCLTTLHGHKNTVSRVRFQPSQGHLLATSGRDMTIRIFDLRTMKDLCILRDHEKEVSSLAWHPTIPSLLSSGSLDGSVRHFVLDELSASTGGSVSVVRAAVSVPHAHENAVWSMEYHPLGHILCTGSNDRSTRFWGRPRVGEIESFSERQYTGEGAYESRNDNKGKKKHQPKEEEEEADDDDYLIDQQMPVPGAGPTPVHPMGNMLPFPPGMDLGGALPLPGLPGLPGLGFPPPPPGFDPTLAVLAAMQQQQQQQQQHGQQNQMPRQ